MTCVPPPPFLTAWPGGSWLAEPEEANCGRPSVLAVAAGVARPRSAAEAALPLSATRPRLARARLGSLQIEFVELATGYSVDLAAG
jgi:hypothetical protein